MSWRRPLRLPRLLSLYFSHFSLRKLAILVLTLVVLIPPSVVLLSIAYGGLPPSYTAVREFERSLPQHNWQTTNASLHQRRPSVRWHGGNTRYLRFPDHLWGHGLNNVLQEALLTSYIAHATQRVFVFEDHVWSHLPLPYTLYDFTLRPTRVPLGAYLSGYIAGQCHLSSDQPPESSCPISAEYFDLVCPKHRRVQISYNGETSRLDGLGIIEWWKARLSEEDVVHAACVEIRESERRIFDRGFFESSRILPLVPLLYESPIFKQFAWSSLVQDALSNVLPILLSQISTQPAESIVPRKAFPGLVALHLRRGDYKRHCTRLAAWRSPYSGFNVYSGLVDKFHPGDEQVAELSSSQLAGDIRTVQDYYLLHCLPSIPQLIHRLRTIKQEYSAAANGSVPLSQIYVLTNAWPSYIDSLSKALHDDGWNAIVSTADWHPFLSAEQRSISVAIDMALAVDHAEVFVGNGFSTVTSNIIMLRTARGLPLSSNRLL